MSDNQHYRIIDYFTVATYFFYFVILLNTEMYNKGEYINARKTIFEHTFQKQIFPDTVLLIILLQNFNPWLKFLFLIKLYGLYSKTRSLFSFIYNQEIQMVLEFIILVLKVINCAHIFACFWYYLAKIEEENGKPNWIQAFVSEQDQLNLTYLYIDSLYYSIITMTTIGYGDFSPQSHNEKIFVIFMSLIACGVFSFVITEIAVIFQKSNKQNEMYLNELNRTNKFLSQYDISSKLRQKLRCYLQYQFYDSTHKTESLDNNQYFPKQLKKMVKLEMNLKILKQVPFLKQFSNELLNHLSLTMNEQSYAPDEVIMKKRDIYIVKQGKISMNIYPLAENQKYKQNSYLVRQYGKNSIIGIDDFFTESKFKFEYISSASTDCFVLPYIKFIEVIKKFPEDYEKWRFLYDQVTFSQKQAIVKCKFCNASSHKADSCPQFWYNAPSSRIIKVLNFQQKNRKSIERKNNKFNVFENINEIEIQAKLIQEEEDEIMDENDNYFMNKKTIKSLNKINQLKNQNPNNIFVRSVNRKKTQSIIQEKRRSLQNQIIFDKVNKEMIESQLKQDNLANKLTKDLKNILEDIDKPGHTPQEIGQELEEIGNLLKSTRNINYQLEQDIEQSMEQLYSFKHYFTDWNHNYVIDQINIRNKVLYTVSNNSNLQNINSKINLQNTNSTQLINDSHKKQSDIIFMPIQEDLERKQVRFEI